MNIETKPSRLTFVQDFKKPLSSEDFVRPGADDEPFDAHGPVFVDETQHTPATDAPAAIYAAAPDDLLRGLALRGAVLAAMKAKALRAIVAPMAAELLAHRAMMGDPLSHYLATACEVTGAQTHRIAATDLAQGFLLFCEEQGHTAPSFVAAARALSARAGRWRHPVSGRLFLRTKKSRSQYRGIRFTPDFAARLTLGRA
jgi:hypothetical protein